MSQSITKICTSATPLTPGYRVRHDGFTADRQRRFLAVLQYSGCVADACRVIGVSTTTAYRVRKQHSKFAEKWDKALCAAQYGLEAIAYKRAVEGTETIVIRNGVEYERRIAPSDTMLALLIKRGRLNAYAFLPDDEVISRAEFEAGYHFDDQTGEKKKMARSRGEASAVRTAFIAKLMQMRERKEASEAREREARGLHVDEDGERYG